jgi:hypothetical protein
MPILYVEQKMPHDLRYQAGFGDDHDGSIKAAASRYTPSPDAGQREIRD